MSDERPLRSAKDVLTEQLEEPDVRRAWEALAPARVMALRLVQHRVEHGLSQSKLGRLLGVSQPAIARLESGEHMPTLPTLLRIAEALDIEILVDIRSRKRPRSWVAVNAESSASVAERITTATGQELLVAAS